MWHLLSSRVHPEGFQFCHHHQQQHDEAGDRTIVNYTDYSYWYFSNSNYMKYCWEMCLAAGWLTLETNPAMVSIVVFRVHPSGFPYSEAFVNGALAITCVCLNIEGSEISLTFLKHEMSLDVFGAYLQKQTPCITSWRVCRILLTVHSSWKKTRPSLRYESPPDWDGSRSLLQWFFVPAPRLSPWQITDQYRLSVSGNQQQKNRRSLGCFGDKKHFRLRC